MNKPIAIIFGAGENIGAATSKAFAAKGYRVALVARSIDTSNTNEVRISIAADLSKVNTVSTVFARVREVWGEPSLIFYNAAAFHRTDPTNPFTIPEEEFAADLAVNTTSVYAAMKEAIASVQTLPNAAAKMLIYTGNYFRRLATYFPERSAWVLGSQRLPILSMFALRRIKKLDSSK